MLRVLSHLVEFPCPKALPLLPSSYQLLLSSNQKLSRVVGSFSGDLGLWSPESQPTAGHGSVLAGGWCEEWPSRGWGVPPAGAGGVWGREPSATGHSLAPGSRSGEGRRKLPGLKCQFCDVREKYSAVSQEHPGSESFPCPCPDAGVVQPQYKHTEPCPVTLWVLSAVVQCVAQHSPVLLPVLHPPAGLGSPPRAVTGSGPAQLVLPSYYFSKLKPEKGVPC